MRARTTFADKTQVFCYISLAHLKRRCAAVFVRGTFATLRPFRYSCLQNEAHAAFPVQGEEGAIPAGIILQELCWRNCAGRRPASIIPVLRQDVEDRYGALPKGPVTDPSQHLGLSDQGLPS